MKMKLGFATLALGIGTTLMAQPGNYQQVEQRAPQAVAPQNAEELAKQFDLSQDKADKAWAIYTEYTSLQKAMHDKQREEMKAIRSKDSKPTDADAEKAFYTRIDSQRNMLDFEVESYKKFTAVISPIQTVKLMRESRQANKYNKRKAQDVRSSQEPVQTKTRQ